MDLEVEEREGEEVDEKIPADAGLYLPYHKCMHEQFHAQSTTKKTKYCNPRCACMPRVNERRKLEGRDEDETTHNTQQLQWLREIEDFNSLCQYQACV